MNVHFSYKDRKPPEVEKEINRQIEKLRKRLQVFRPELVHLKGSVEQNSAREGMTVSLNLRLPSGQMAVQKSGPNAQGVVKAAFEDLVQQINRHKDLLRNSRKWQRRRSEKARSDSMVPFEETVAAVQVPTASPDDVRSYVNANLARLERFVERQLAFREADDGTFDDSVTKEEVIGEAIARALGDDADKPERVAIEPWLYRLALDAIRDLASGNREHDGSVHLEDSARARNVRASDEPELQYHQPDESLTEENVIADRRVATPEDAAYSDEMVNLVQVALGGTGRADREAFILHAIEGFSVDEIAVITARAPEAVRASIEAAGEHLRRSKPLAGRLGNRQPQTPMSK
jgi:DNA-directed RNA polymerase specialized sigma24 family protein/ribosome-associated translation inhibitor RaiA